MHLQLLCIFNILFIKMELNKCNKIWVNWIKIGISNEFIVCIALRCHDCALMRRFSSLPFVTVDIWLSNPMLCTGYIWKYKMCFFCVRMWSVWKNQYVDSEVAYLQYETEPRYDILVKICLLILNCRLPLSLLMNLIEFPALSMSGPAFTWKY